MGIRPIDYHPWKGERTSYLRRTFVIVKNIFIHKISSKGILALLIIGGILTHFPRFLSLAFFPIEKLEATAMINYYNDFLLYIFLIILGAVVTSDLISDDINSNSFVLYFSRPIKPIDYLFGKYSGAFLVISVFSLIPPLLYGIAVIALQTGTDYMGSLEVLSSTFLAGFIYCAAISGFGTMLSSITERKSYAGGGTFISFIITIPIGELFSNFDPNWKLVNPLNLFNYSVRIIYGKDIPSEINSNIFGAIMLGLLVIPIIFTFYRIHNKAVGK